LSSSEAVGEEYPKRIKTLPWHPKKYLFPKQIPPFVNLIIIYKIDCIINGFNA